MNTTPASVLDLAIAAANAYDRPDMAARLAPTREALADPSYKVMVVGEFKQGKSSLVNALINADVCPVDDDIATAIPTFIRHAEEPWARVVTQVDETVDVRPIDFGELPAVITDIGGRDSGVNAAEIGVPRSLLAQGITLIDTPGVGGLGSAHTAATLAALPRADALVFVSDASQEYGRPELEFLRMARDVVPEIAYVLTKVDLYPEWKRIRDIDIEHLARLGIDAEPIPTSALLRRHAIRHDDRQINMESGYPQLVEFLRSRVQEPGADRASMAAGELVVEIVDQLDATFAAEEEALTDPDRIQEMADRFEEARRTADELRSNAARWQITLNDGVQDLGADFDHRLRGRMRAIIKEAEAALDTQDPTDVWDRFESWLKQRIAADTAETYLELSMRVDALSTTIADHFDDHQGTLGLKLDIAGIAEKAGDIEVRSRIDDTGQGGALSSGITAMRGSYGGFLMFGMLGQLVGFTMLNPATAVIGILMGGRAVRDEKQRQLLIRRQQAKATVRQFIDDASFELNKEIRDELRRLQRALRDHYSACADELKKSVTASLAAAKSAAQSDQSEREKRIADVRAERGRLSNLRAQAQQLARAQA
jgi:hypothetical protein